MSLRRWQLECITCALSHYSRDQHFLCQATPGAGKTRMAAELAKRLLEQNKIDAVVCFAPSCQVVDGFQKTFSDVLNMAFDGRIGAVGMALSYQSIEHQSNAFWRLFERMRILVIFDEIHHCAGGDEIEGGNFWGQQIIQQLQDAAAYTLAMSGTPWRSDEKVIALARYSTPEGRLIVDYQYSLMDAIEDGVCRTPQITLLDHPQISVKNYGLPAQIYEGFDRLLKHSAATYESLAVNEDINIKLLELARNQLDIARLNVADAAGLVVATNIEHAHKLAALLQQMGENALVVSTHRPDAGAAIDQFRIESSKWIVAVGMISEGTDIPRLAVCCYLSRIRTEMSFRQVLGRVLRRRGRDDDQAWMFMIAEPELIACAERLMEDLPEHLAYGNHLQFVPLEDREAGSCSANGAQDYQLNITEDAIAYADGNSQKNVGGSQAAGFMGQLILSGSFRERLLNFF